MLLQQPTLRKTDDEHNLVQMGWGSFQGLCLHTVKEAGEDSGVHCVSTRVSGGQWEPRGRGSHQTLPFWLWDTGQETNTSVPSRDKQPACRHGRMKRTIV